MNAKAPARARPNDRWEKRVCDFYSVPEERLAHFVLLSIRSVCRKEEARDIFYFVFDYGRLFCVTGICPPQQKKKKKKEEKNCDCRGRGVCVFGKRDSRRRVSSARSLMSLASMFGGWCDTVCSLVLRKSSGQAYLWHRRA